MKDRTALVIGGGGARGAYALGVTKYLRDRGKCDQGFNFDMVIGNSCGAIVGAVYYGDLFESVTNVYLGITRKDVMRLTPLRFLVGKGLFSPSPLRSLIKTHIPETAITNGEGTFAVVCTDVGSGDLIVFDSREHAGQMQAALCISAAIPVMVPPIAYKDMHLADGGYRTILPIWTALNMGATKVLAISVSPHRVKTLECPPRGPLRLLLRWIELLTLQVEKDEVAVARLWLDEPNATPAHSKVKLILPQNAKIPAPADFAPKTARDLYRACPQLEWALVD